MRPMTSSEETWTERRRLMRSDTRSTTLSSNQLMLSTRVGHQSETASTSLRSTSKKHHFHPLSSPECLVEPPIKIMAHQCTLMLAELCTIMNQENSHLQEGNSSEKELDKTRDPKLIVLREMDQDNLQANHNQAINEDFQSVVTNK